MKRNALHNFDQVLFVIVMVLLLLGTAIIFSASSFWSADRHNDYAMYLKRHLLRVVLGLVLMFLASKIDYHRYREFTPFMVLGIFVLLVSLFFFPVFNKVHRTLPLFGQKFQPAETMKLMMVFYMAAVLAKGNVSNVLPLGESPLLPHYLYLVITTGLVFLEPDMGTAMVVFFIGLTMFFLGGVPKRTIAQMVGVIMPFIVLGMVLKPYQWQRLKVFVQSHFGSEPPPYQIEHSLIAFSRGGFFGVGFGEGHEKNLYLPQPFSDFILPNLGEELGFVGIAFLLFLLFVLLWRGCRIALRAKDQYGFLLAGGIMSMILINALINAGVVMNLLPVSGLPFPFISYGGSALFVNMFAMGILLNISKNRVTTFKDFTLERGQTGWQP